MKLAQFLKSPQPPLDAGTVVLQFPGMLDASRCSALAALFDARAALAKAQTPEVDPTAFPLDDRWTDEARALLIDAMEICIRRIEIKTGDDVGAGALTSLYPETLALAMLREGDEIGRHCDNGAFDGQGRWLPNAHARRTVSGIFYLNQDFDGGDIVFDHQGLAIRPATGLLVLFASGRHCPHRVERVVCGRRYSMAMWFTVHRWHALLPRRFEFMWPASTPDRALPQCTAGLSGPPFSTR